MELSFHFDAGKHGVQRDSESQAMLELIGF